jgi:SAM-dependent methyltransferase
MPITHRDDCRICGSKDLVKFLSLGNMPLAGGFIHMDQIKDEKSYPLDVYFCRNCKEVQLLDVVSADVLFEDYRFLSSVTRTLSEHFHEYAATMKNRFKLGKDSLVVEFGSNDGVLQKPFEDMGVKAVGFEPAKNVAKLAMAKGLTVVNDFFNTRTVKPVIEKYGHANLICANNVFAHIDDMHEAMRTIKLLLKPNGVFVFEVHYLADLLEKYQYDMIYHEHLMYHSLAPLSHLMHLFGMEIFDVERIPIHSGSIRVYSRLAENRSEKISENVGNLLKTERTMGLYEEETFSKFAENIEAKRDELVETVKELRSKGKRIVGYGASGRASVQLNFCKLDPEDIGYVVDMSPEREGRVMPGVHMPIVDPKVLRTDKPDYAILFAYNYEKEVLGKETEFLDNGGRFIIPLPEVRIVP